MMIKTEIIYFCPSAKELYDLKPRCSFCGKRPATKLCDAPIRRGHYIGHPPRSELEKAKRYDIAFRKVEMVTVHTCDRQICDECATEIYRGIDYCPSCMERIKNTLTTYKRSLKK